VPDPRGCRIKTPMIADSRRSNAKTLSAIIGGLIAAFG
jgi:hypothetical protein